jgi:hypothetical protein
MGVVNWNTSRDQDASPFERMSQDELEAMFELQGEGGLRTGSNGASAMQAPQPAQNNWSAGTRDGEPFPVHMGPAAASNCLRGLSAISKPGGYLFVTGVDLDLLTGFARELGWTPVTELTQKIHEGDGSIRRGWPLNYWVLEPLDERPPAWGIRYSSVFQIGKPV